MHYILHVNRSIQRSSMLGPRITSRMGSNYDRFEMSVSKCLVNLGSQDYGGLNQRKPGLKTDATTWSVPVSNREEIVDEGQIGRHSITP